MGKHSLLSASSCPRWLKCPPSARLNAMASDQASSYAREGTCAHALCEHLLNTALGRDSTDPTEDLDYYDSHMQQCAEGYRDYVMEQVHAAGEAFVCVEQSLDFSRWVPEAFGTGDAVIVSDDVLHIIDFKYGKGVLVKAQENPQLMCYALGALDTFGCLYDFTKVRLTIYQPRRDNVDTFDLTREELLRWGDGVLAPIAQLAFDGKGELRAGDHCLFCKVKANCREMANQSLQMSKYEFQDPSLLTDDEIAAILPQVDALLSWGGAIRRYALHQALSGVPFEGYRVVGARSNRQYTDEDAVARAVISAGYDPYERKLLSVTEMTALLGRSKFYELLGGLVYRPQGKPTLVPADDPRPDYQPKEAKYE